jgi:hypothetical protein
VKKFRAAISLLFILQLSTGVVILHENPSKDTWVIQRSWGLGLTIPNGSPLEDGSRVEWGEHRNITVVLTLPNISYTDKTIYFIVSIMTKQQTIIQAAIGIHPNNTYWTSSFMYVKNVYQHNKTYVAVLLDSPPYFHPYDKASISIYYRPSEDGAGGVWASSITNLSTGESIDVDILVDNSSTFMDGEQEVIAFESYTSNEKIFEQMGQAILHSILVDGRRVLGGWYIDDGQVFDRRPLFEVGGGRVPSFISIIFKNDGTIAWIYSKPTWNNSLSPIYSIMFLLLLVISIIIVVYVAYRIKS